MLVTSAHAVEAALPPFLAGSMEVVELNVGGRLFTTTRSTLSKHAGSMLAAMFSGDMQPALQDSQGRYFIDRNGDWFAVILSYLREEPVQFLVFGIQRQALTAEARYYQVSPKLTSGLVFAVLYVAIVFCLTLLVAFNS